MPEESLNRTDRFQENSALNALLGELQELLTPIQNNLPPSDPIHPVGFIIGNPRSGTTVLLQWLASLGCFSYPTNLLTRFAYAPYIGTLVQKMLFHPEYDYHGDFADIQSNINFSSDLGKSKGALAGNEFQHFFRNYMPNFELQWLTEEQLGQVDCAGISSGLASIEKGFGKPFVSKANILQFNLPFFHERIPSLIWIHIARDPLFVMQSILTARERYYGNRKIWWSGKPKEYNQLKNVDVYHQIAGQVYFTEKAIREGLKSVPQTNQLTVQYESFCEDPETVYRQIVDKYAAFGCELPAKYNDLQSFECSNKIRLSAKDIDALKASYAELGS